MSIARGARRPEAESAIDVHPRAVPVGAVADLRGRVERSAIDVARLNANDRAVVECGQGFGPHPALPIHRDSNDPAPSQPYQTERLDQRQVDLADRPPGNVLEQLDVGML